MAASDTPWNFAPSDYSPQQWQRACLIDTEQGPPDSKDRYKLPVLEPSGAVNRNGVHAAAARINQVEGVPATVKVAAARKLVTMYRTDLAETPPDSLNSLVDSGERNAPPETERLWTNTWYKNGSPLEIRKGADGSPSRVIGGYAAMFDKRSQPLGGFVEVVEPTFFNKSKSDGWPQVICRYNHEDNMLLGTTSSGTLQLALDDIGLDYSVDLPLCRGDVHEMVQRRDIRNSSFAFQVYDQDWKPSEGGYPVRHLLSGRLIDVAPVCTPAYPDATVGLRSLARHCGVPMEDVTELAGVDELRKLFVRTDNRGVTKPTTKTKTGREALMETLAMRADDPIGETA
jgi:uncharacterized protein